MSNLAAMLDHTYQLEDVMRHSPVTIGTEATEGEAANILAVGEFHSLPIVDGNSLKDIVTSSDLIRYLAEAIQ